MRHFLLSLVALLSVSTMAMANPTIDANGYLDLTETPSYVASGATVVVATNSSNMEITYASGWEDCQWGWWDNNNEGLVVYGVYSSIVAVVKSASPVFMCGEVVDATAWNSGNGQYIESTVTPTSANDETTITLDISNFSSNLLKINLKGTVASQTIEVVSIQFIAETSDEGTSTAIANIASDVEVVEVARYNLMGQKISGAEKGINIIVYSDGSAKKVLVK